MKYGRSIVVSVAVVAAGLFALATPAAATALGNKTFISNTDFASFGVGGMRGTGSGTIAVTGITGTVTKALLYWNGPTNGAASVNAAVNFDGTPITGTNIGTSSDNCWGFANSQSYRADVTSNVNAHTGGPNGSYPLSGFRKTSGEPEPTVDADINGVSLVVFFSDGNAANNRDVTIVDGNDSNFAFGSDLEGWDATISGIAYQSGAAHLQLHVGDGQSYSDGAVNLNDGVLVGQGSNFQGDSVPGASYSGNPASVTGNLWDIKSYEITSFMSSPSTTLHLTSPLAIDCLSLVAAVVDVPTATVSGQADYAAGFYDGVNQLDIQTVFGPKGDSMRSEIIVPPPCVASATCDPYKAGPVTDQEKSAKDPAYITFCGNAQCDAQVDVSLLPSGSQPDSPIQVILYYKDDALKGDAVYAQGDGDTTSFLLANCDSSTVARVGGSPAKCVASITTTKGNDKIKTIVVLVPSGADPTIGKR